MVLEQRDEQQDKQFNSREFSTTAISLQVSRSQRYASGEEVGPKLRAKKD